MSLHPQLEVGGREEVNKDLQGLLKPQIPPAVTHSLKQGHTS